MLLSCRFLRNVQNVNSFEQSNTMELFAGDTQTLYLQLVDSGVDRTEQGFSPPGRRYIPGAGASLQVTFENIDDAKRVVRLATQPFANDPSIWSVPLLATDPFKGTVMFTLKLNDGAKVFNSSGQPLMLRVR